MKTALRFSIVTLLALGVAACGAPGVSDLGNAPAGDDDDDGGTPPPGADPSVSITSSGVTLEMRDAKNLDFTVTGHNGFTGPVTVTAAGLPAGVTANSTTVNIATANETVAGVLNLTSDHTLVTPGTYADAKVVATAGAVTADDLAPISVDAVLLIDTKAPGTGGVPDMWGAPVVNAGDPGLVVRRGTAKVLTLKFKNTDTIKHLMHGPGAGTLGGDVDGNPTTGFEHGDTAAASPEGNPGDAGIQTRTLNVSGVTSDTVVNFYCHTHGSPTTLQQGRLTVTP